MYPGFEALKTKCYGDGWVETERERREERHKVMREWQAVAYHR